MSGRGPLVLGIAALLGCGERRERPPAAAAGDGCVEGAGSALHIRVIGVPENEAVLVEATAPGGAPAGVAGADSTRATWACAGAECARGAWLPGFAPDSVDLRVRTRGGVVRRLLAPAYRTPAASACPVGRLGAVRVPFAG